MTQQEKNRELREWLFKFYHHWLMSCSKLVENDGWKAWRQMDNILKHNDL